MRSFSINRRVVVQRTAEGLVVNAPGRVVRLRRGDDGAWVELDQRLADESLHPFPASDTRGKHVLAFPEDCDPAAPAPRVVRAP